MHVASEREMRWAMATQELEQDTFARDVLGVAKSVEQQLQCCMDRDKVVTFPVSSNNATSDHAGLLGLDAQCRWH